MSNETKEILQVPTDAELTASGPVAQSPEEAAKMLAEDKVKSKKPKAERAKCKEATEADMVARLKAARAKAAEQAGALKAVGLAACQRHGLKCVWVTDDGQCFDQESNARAHGNNLGKPEILKVEA